MLVHDFMHHLGSALAHVKQRAPSGRQSSSGNLSAFIAAMKSSIRPPKNSKITGGSSHPRPRAGRPETVSRFGPAGIMTAGPRYCLTIVRDPFPGGPSATAGSVVVSAGSRNFAFIRSLLKQNGSAEASGAIPECG